MGYLEREREKNGNMNITVDFFRDEDKGQVGFEGESRIFNFLDPSLYLWGFWRKGLVMGEKKNNFSSPLTRKELKILNL